MSKVNLSDLSTDINVVTRVNSNNAIIEAAFDNTLSRDGTSPNAMEASLDMNSNRILNLPEPASATEPMRLVDATGITLLSQALPSQTSNSGKSLTTNGTNLSWSNLPPYFDRTTVEIAAGVTPTNFYCQPCDVERYATNTTPGTTDMSSALSNASAVSALGGGDIVVRSLIRLSSNVTIATGASLSLEQGGRITVDNTRTLTINGKIKASRASIFTGAGTVKYGVQNVDFPMEGIAFPEWFGAVHDNSTDDTNAIQLAINMVAPCYGAVSFTSGYYKTTSSLTMKSRVRLFGINQVASVISFVPGSASQSAITGDAGGTDNCLIEHLGITCSGGSTGKRGITLTSVASAWRLKNMSFSGCNDWCYFHDSLQYGTIEQCAFDGTHNATNSGVAVITSTFANRFSVRHCRFSNNDRDFKINTLGSSITFSENSCEHTGSA